jgi:hypothetical protein
MKRFYGVGDKYARNIWMDSYHPDFRDAIAVDERIKKATEALGYSFKTYADHERFYQEVAEDAGLQGWEVDRLLYNHLGEFLDAITANEEERPTDPDEESVGQQSDPVIHGSSEEVATERRFSATNLMALSGLPRALEIIEATIDAEVREELTRLAGNKPRRAPGNLVRQIREDEGYYVYASLDTEKELGCYVGYALGSPDGYPKLQVGLYAVAGEAETEVWRMAIERVSRLEGWWLNLENAEEHEVRRERDLGSLLGEKNHVAAAKGFFTGCIGQIRGELTIFKEENPGLLWNAG